MQERIEKYLLDIQMAINEIDSYFLQYPYDFSIYQQTPILKKAIERNLEIIGEAMNRILKLQPDIAITSAKRIVGLRNQIIHAYDGISDENIWAVVIKHLPILQKEVKILTDHEI